MKIVYLATPDIAIKSFEFFIKSADYEVVALVTQPAKPALRGKKIIDRKIKLMALENDIKIFEPLKISKDIDTINALRAMKPDFFVTFAFGQILSQEVIDIPKIATINLHASLLPKYRGANPIQEAIANGDKITGITTMKTVLELDCGDICLQEKIEISDNSTIIDLMEKISAKSPSLLDKTLKGLFEGKIISTKQDENFASYTKKILKDDKNITFNECAKLLHDKIRSMCGINTVHVKFKDKLIKIIKTECVQNCDNGALFLGANNENASNNAVCGEVLDVNKNGITVKCKDYAILIKTVKPEGKKEMDAFSWSLGSKIKKGDMFLQCVKNQ